MGLSSKKVKTKTSETATTAPNPMYAGQINAAADALKPGYQDSVAAAKQFSPLLGKAGTYYGDVMGGKYLGGNPHLNDIVSSSNADITDAVNQQFMPRFGSGYHAKTLARELGNNEAKLRYGDYAMERGYQNDAGRNLAGIATTATALPMLPGQSYADAISGLLGRYMTSTGTGTSETKQSGGLLGGLLGSVLSGFASGGLKI